MALEPEKPIERELSVGQSHSYRITAAAGQFTQVIVDQRGIDVLLALVGVDGKTIIERDRPNGARGSEVLSFIAMSEGDYRLDVRAMSEKAGAGKYEIRSNAPRLPTVRDKTEIEAEIIFREGQLLSQARARESVIEARAKYAAAARLWRDTGNKYAEALTETALALSLSERERTYDDSSKNWERAINAHERALDLYRELHDRENEALSLGHLSILNAYLVNANSAAQYLKAQSLFRELHDASLERALRDRFSGAAAAYRAVGVDLIVNPNVESLHQALTIFALTLEMYGALEDQENVALSLLSLGHIYDGLGEKRKALDYYNRALPVVRACGDKQEEATSLNNIGLVFSSIGEQQKALDYYDQALRLYRTIGNKHGEAATLTNTGGAYHELHEEHKALEYFTRALSAERTIGNRSSEARVLNNIGSVYASLGNNQKALDFYNDALPIWQAIRDKEGESMTLNNIGGAYHDLGEPESC